MRKGSFCLLSGLVAIAASFARADILPGRFFRFERLQPQLEGPATIGFSSIAQDKGGFLWLGTSAGLVRYDGYRFKLFRPPAEPGRPLQGIGIYPITISRSGAIWLGTNGRGLLKFNPETGEFAEYRASPGDPKGLPDGIVLGVQEDHRGDLWVGTRSHGVVRFDPSTGEFTRVPLGPGADVVWDVLADRQGAIWVGTLDVGLFRIDPATGETVNFRTRAGDPASLGSDSVWTVFEDHKGTIWIGTKGGGLNRYEPGRDGFSRFFGDADHPRDLAGQTISAIAEDSAGRLWLGTVTDGLRVLNRASRELVSFRHDPQDPESLGDDNVTSITRDASGILWIGTVRGGLNKCLAGEARFEHYRRNPSNPRSLSHNDVRALWAETGTLWVGSKAGLERIDRAAGRVIPYRLAPPGASGAVTGGVLALRGDSSGTLWIGTGSSGLARLDPRSGRITWYRHDPKDPAGLSNDRVNALWIDDADPGVAWIGTQHGLNRFDGGTGRWSRFLRDPGDPASLCNDIVTAIRGDGPGHLWIGTRGGLSRFEKGSGRCESYVSRLGDPPGAGPVDNIVNCVHVDGAGIVWIGTNAGLNRFDGSRGEWQVFAQKDGLAGEVVCGIQEDGAGALWISTNRGVSRFDPESGVARSYGLWHGLQTGAFNPGASARDPDGLMFFGGTNGLNAFDLGDIRKSPFMPSVVWTAYYRNNTEVHPPGSLSNRRTLVLPFKAPLVRLEFAALDFTAPEMNSFAYRLEPRDTEWIPLIPEHSVSLIGLGAGTYRLRVKAANPDGLWNEDGIAIDIRVPLPFWKTWWFLTAALAVLATGTALVARAWRKARAGPGDLGDSLEAILGTFDLTEREDEILRLVLQGARNKDIERKLFISASTVRNHLYNVYQKLGVGNRLELINRIAREAREKSDKTPN
ncbi:MAG TPA: two-component regulator propeller domain-containing protein [Acidobacteriota bacterium]|nr:two-component regulator propeller domain-containing protein [Acidobacteriota bacterium]